MNELPVAPPQCVEAEMELLGALLAYYSPRIMGEIEKTSLGAADFYRPSHGAVFEAIQAVHAEGAHVDTQTVARQLGPALEPMGGQAAVDTLEAFCVAHGVVERARMIREDAEWRRRLVGCYEAIEACHDRDGGRYASALIVA